MLRVNTMWASMGFEDPILNSQENFRKILYAMAYPGRIVMLEKPSQAPEGVHVAAWATLLTLCDASVKFYCDLPQDHMAALALNTLCHTVTVQDPHDADMVLLTQPQTWTTLCRFHMGTEDQPELGATVIAQLTCLASAQDPYDDGVLLLSGPGIFEQTGIRASGCLPDFWSWRKDTETLYPRGIDLFLTCGRFLTAIPRSVRVIGTKGILCTSP